MMYYYFLILEDFGLDFRVTFCHEQLSLDVAS